MFIQGIIELKHQRVFVELAENQKIKDIASSGID
jgi:hypothetical protein